MQLNTIDAPTLKKWLDNGEAILIDVREPAEHKTSHIPGATLKPSGLLSASDLAVQGKKVVLHCQRGSRGTNTCQRLLEESSTSDALELYNLEGGIEAWKQAGLPIGEKGGSTLPLDRQVQLTIGTFVLFFSLLAYFVSPKFLMATAFIGLGLINAGLTGWCGLARLMGKMPWNQ